MHNAYLHGWWRVPSFGKAGTEREPGKQGGDAHPSTHTPKQLTRLSWPARTPTCLPVRVSHTSAAGCARWHAGDAC